MTNTNRQSLSTECLVQKVGQWLSLSSGWIFPVVIAIMSLILVYESTRKDWLVFLSTYGALSICFLSILIFGFLKSYFNRHFQSSKYWIIWAICFLVIPIAIIQTKAYLPLKDLFVVLAYHRRAEDIEPPLWVILNVTYLGLLATELLLLSQNRVLTILNRRYKWRGLRLEQGIFLLMILISIAVAAINIGNYNSPTGNEFQGGIYTVFTFVGWAIQYFLMLLIYYLFYWINHYVLIDKLFKEKGPIYYLFALTGLIILGYPIAAQLIYFLPIVHQIGAHPVADGRIFAEINLFIPLLGTLATIPFILIIQWLKLSNEVTALGKEKADTELSLLKQQINPHFFFNTLNNLYALSIKNDASTPKVILKLSALMRYVIYKGKQETVTLADEIQYLEDYLELQQIRLHKELDYRFEKKVSHPNLQIPPLLFIILVENAFKHGIEPAEGACFLHIQFRADDKQVEFICSNSVEEKLDEATGIGLENLRRRLELRFPARHSLEVQEEDGQFKARLAFFTN